MKIGAARQKVLRAAFGLQRAIYLPISMNNLFSTHTQKTQTKTKKNLNVFFWLW